MKNLKPVLSILCLLLLVAAVPPTVVRLRNLERATTSGRLLTSNSSGYWRPDSTFTISSLSSIFSSLTSRIATDSLRLKVLTDRVVADSIRLVDSCAAIRADFPTSSSGGLAYGDLKVNSGTGAYSTGVNWTFGGPGTGVNAVIVDSFGANIVINGTQNLQWYHGRPTLNVFKPWVHDSCVFEFTAQMTSSPNIYGFCRPSVYNNATRTLLNPDTVGSALFLRLAISLPTYFVRVKYNNGGSKTRDSVTVTPLANTLRHRYRIKISDVDSCVISVDNGAYIYKRGPVSSHYALMPVIAAKHSGGVATVWDAMIKFY